MLFNEVSDLQPAKNRKAQALDKGNDQSGAIPQAIMGLTRATPQSNRLNPVRAKYRALAVLVLQKQVEGTSKPLRA